MFTLPITITMTPDDGAKMTDNPATWPEMPIGRELGAVRFTTLVIRPMANRAAAFDPRTHSAWVYVDPARQVDYVGPMLPIWVHRPAFLDAPPSWYVEGVPVFEGMRACCRLHWPCMPVGRFVFATDALDVEGNLMVDGLVTLRRP